MLLKNRNSRLRNWVALWLQGRRRGRAAGPTVVQIPAPTILFAWYSWDDSEFGWADTFFAMEFNQAAVPVAEFEVWSRDSHHAYYLLEVIPSEANTDPYHHFLASQTLDTFYYKVRYRNGGVFGPFSNEISVEIETHP